MTFQDTLQTDAYATIKTERLPIKLWLDVDQVE